MALTHEPGTYNAPQTHEPGTYSASPVDELDEPRASTSGPSTAYSSDPAGSKHPVASSSLPANNNYNDTEDELRRRPNRAVTLDAPNNADGIARPGVGSRRSSRRNLDPNMTPFKRMTTSLFTPDRPVGPAPTYMQSFKAVALSSWINILLVFIPIGWALHFVKANGNDKISDTAVFCTTFIAIMPLAGLLGFETEEVSMRLGQTLGGLVNATLGNAVELIVAILALIKCELAVVQSSLVGSILSNLLLVLGMCFFAGGLRFAEQSMKSTAAQLNSSLLLIAVIAVLIPSAFHFAFNTTAEKSSTPSEVTPKEATDLLAMSHGVAIILLLIYIGFMLFQMWTHAHLYQDEETSTSTAYGPAMSNIPGRVKRRIKNVARRKKTDPEVAGEKRPEVDENGNPVETVAETASVESDDEEIPQMNVVSTVIAMLITVVLVGVTAEFLVDSINGMVEANPSLSAEWVGLILLPIVGNAAEHFTAVSVSVKDKLDLSISVAVGSSIQVALFVIPVIELLAWTIGKPMTLLFDPFESVVLFFTVIIVNQTIADGRSNWMEGLILILFYVLLAVAFWYYPGSNTATLLGCHSAT